MILINFGGVIAGESQVTGHEKWINVGSMQWGVGRAISPVAGGSDRDTSNPSFSEVTFSHSMDVSSAELFAQACGGKKICDKMEVHFIQTAGEASGQYYLKVHFYDPLVSSYSQSSGGERPEESFSVSFTKMEMQYDKYDKSGSKTEGTMKGWDLAVNAYT